MVYITVILPTQFTVTLATTAGNHSVYWKAFATSKLMLNKCNGHINLFRHNAIQFDKGFLIIGGAGKLFTEYCWFNDDLNNSIACQPQEPELTDYSFDEVFAVIPNLCAVWARVNRCQKDTYSRFWILVVYVFCLRFLLSDWEVCFVLPVVKSIKNRSTRTQRSSEWDTQLRRAMTRLLVRSLYFYWLFINHLIPN